MAIDKKFVNQLVNITSKAALASSYHVGKKDKIAADKAAVDSMRHNLNNLDFRSKICSSRTNVSKIDVFRNLRRLVQLSKIKVSIRD